MGVSLKLYQNHIKCEAVNGLCKGPCLQICGPSIIVSCINKDIDHLVGMYWVGYKISFLIKSFPNLDTCTPVFT